MKRLVLVMIAFSAVLLADCKKKKAPVKILDPDFSVVGDRSILNYISFLSNQPQGSDVNWEFGDGSGTFDLVPIHKYANTGDYIVTLTANGKSISKTISISLGTQRIRQGHTWIKRSKYSDVTGPYLLDSSLTTLSLDMIGDSIVILPADNKISYLNSEVQVRLANYLYPAINFSNANGTARLSYYPDKDSIYIYRYINVPSPPGTYSSEMMTR